MKRREFIRMGGDRCQTTLKSEKRKNHCSPWDQLWGSFPGLLREASNFLQWTTGNHPTGEPNCASRSVLKFATSPSLQSLQTQAREWPLKALLILYLDIPLPLKGTRGGLELYCRAFWSFPSLLLSHSLGVFDGSIQGAEEGSTFLHHTVEVHLMEKVTLGITEILGAKPAQNRQADISGKVSGEKWSWNRHFFLCFSTLLAFPHTTVIPGNLEPESSYLLPWIGGYPTDGRDEASPMQQLQPGLQKYCTAPSLMYRTTTLPRKLQSKTPHYPRFALCHLGANGQEGRTSSAWCHCSPTAEILWTQ